MGDPEARLTVIAPALDVAGIARPGPFTRGAVGKFEGPARNVWASWPPPGCRGHAGELGSPPRPHLTFSTIPFGPISEGTSDTDESSHTVAKIPFRPGPTLCALHDELMPTKTTKDGGRVPCRNAEHPRSGFNRQYGELPQHRVELPCQVTKAGSRKKVVPLVSELFLEDGYLISSHVEELCRGAGVIWWL